MGSLFLQWLLEVFRYCWYVGLAWRGSQGGCVALRWMAMFMEPQGVYGAAGGPEVVSNQQQ